MKKTKTARAVDLMIHNPQRPSSWPGERTTMKKKNSKGKGSQALAKRNQFKSGGKSSAMTKAKPKKNGFQRKGFFGGFRNPLSRFTEIGGVSVVQIAVGGVATLVVQGISPLLPGVEGSWVRILSQAGVVIGLVYIAPKSMKTPVAIGGGAVPAVGALNKLTNNAIPNAFNSFGGYLQPAPAPQAGMAGFQRPIYRTAQVW